MTRTHLILILLLINNSVHLACQHPPATCHWFDTINKIKTEAFSNYRPASSSVWSPRRDAWTVSRKNRRQSSVPFCTMSIEEGTIEWHDCTIQKSPSKQNKTNNNLWSFSAMHKLLRYVFDTLCVCLFIIQLNENHLMLGTAFCCT